VLGIDFLRSTKLQTMAKKSKVIVIGGGNTAMDTAKTALRSGAQNVTILYRRTMREIPAFEDEVEDTLSEGISIETLTAPIAFIGNNKLDAVRLVCMELADIGVDGRARPVPIEGSHNEIPCDLAIIATGQGPGGDFKNSLMHWEGGRIWVDEWNRTSSAGIFAGGDITPAKASVVDAMATGKRAALGIHLVTARGYCDEDLKSANIATGPVFSLTAFFKEPENPALRQVAFPDKLTLCMLERQPPEKITRTEVTERINKGGEYIEGFTIEQARKEGARCLVCGTCVGCNRCLVFCPEGIVIPPEEPCDKYTYRDEFCKGCGTCASVCFRGIIEMGEKDR
jgi:heterodisulfide reductase subunit A